MLLMTKRRRLWVRPRIACVALGLRPYQLRRRLIEGTLPARRVDGRLMIAIPEPARGLGHIAGALDYAMLDIIARQRRAAREVESPKHPMNQRKGARRPSLRRAPEIRLAAVDTGEPS